MFLCTITAADLIELSGGPLMPGEEPKSPTVDLKLIMVGQASDCSSYLVLTPVEHEKLIKQTSVPEGYDFIFRQAWGLTINEEIIHRVISTLRAEAYPPLADYLDAKVKDDAVAEQAYIDACIAVKVKYPKFSF
jgi:hypothetical protein